MIRIAECPPEANDFNLRNATKKVITPRGYEDDVPLLVNLCMRRHDVHVAC